MRGFLRRADPGRPQHRDFRWFWIGDTVSTLGSGVTVLALPLVAMGRLHASPFRMGLLGSCEFAAFLLVGLPAGAWVDRMRRRRVLVVCDLGRAALLGSVPIAAAFDLLTFAHLCLVVFAGGVLRVFFSVAYQSLVPEIVDSDRIPAAMARVNSTHGLIDAAGPAVAGFLVARWGASPAVGADAASFALSALALRRIRSSPAPSAPPADPPRRRLLADVKAGLDFVLGNVLLRAMVLRSALFNLFNSLMTTMFVVLLAERLRIPAGTIGLVFALAGLAATLGALLSARVVRVLGDGPTIVWMAVVVGVGALAMPLARPGPLLWTAALGDAVGSLAVVISNITQVSYRQRACPPGLLGRVNATNRFLSWGTVPLGALLGGCLGQALGVRETLWLGAAGELLSVLPLLFSPLLRARKFSFVPEQNSRDRVSA